MMEKIKVLQHSEVTDGTNTSRITTYDNGDIEIRFEETQLGRIEKKVDRILELLEGKELSTSYEFGKLSDLPDSAIKLLNLGNSTKD